jgi:hypothetical protein
VFAFICTVVSAVSAIVGSVLIPVFVREHYREKKWFEIQQDQLLLESPEFKAAYGEVEDFLEELSQ